MLMNVKSGAFLTINGRDYRVTGTSMERVGADGTSDKVGFTAISMDGQVLEFEFSPTTIGVDEKQLAIVLSSLKRLIAVEAQITWR